MVGYVKLGVAMSVVALLAACDGRGGGYSGGGYSGSGYSGSGYNGSGYNGGYGPTGSYQAQSCRDGARCDRDDNPPGPRGGPGTNWENPPGPAGGPGASPNRRDTDYYRR